MQNQQQNQAPAPYPAQLFCPHCGQQVLHVVAQCAACGGNLTHLFKQGAAGDATGGVIPYKNPPALVGYYLGVFALIPFIGIPLGIAAVILGIIGLNKARKTPAVRGQAHAWVAIVLGTLAALGYTFLFLMARML